MDNSEAICHRISVDQRKNLRVAGVKNVLSFDDETILLDTVMGRLTIKGEQLHIVDFHTETGDLTADGRLHALVYLTENKSSGGFVSRLFR